MNGGDAVRRGAPVVVLLTMVAALFLAGLLVEAQDGDGA